METLIIDALPAVINTNYEVVRAQLEQELEKYNVVVTADTVKESKALATQLNKVKIEIATRRKEEISKVSGPLKEFEAQVKNLESMCEDGRQGILEQVRVFEAVRLTHIKSDLEALLGECYAIEKIEKEFQTADIEGLVKMGSYTAGGQLTKAAREGVSSLVAECALSQSRTSLRISELENESHRCGLHSPLTREHIAGFLFEPDEEYRHNLAALIARELERQTETVRKAQEAQVQHDAEALAAADIEQPGEPMEPDLLDDLPEDRAPLTRQAQIEEQIRPTPYSHPHQPLEQEAAKPKGTRPWRISIMLGGEAPGHISLEEIEAALRKKLAAAGVEKSVMSLHVVENP